MSRSTRTTRRAALIAAPLLTLTLLTGAGIAPAAMADSSVSVTAEAGWPAPAPSTWLTGSSTAADYGLTTAFVGGDAGRLRVDLVNTSGAPLRAELLVMPWANADHGTQDVRLGGRIGPRTVIKATSVSGAEPNGAGGTCTAGGYLSPAAQAERGLDVCRIQAGPAEVLTAPVTLAAGEARTIYVDAPADWERPTNAGYSVTAIMSSPTTGVMTDVRTSNWNARGNSHAIRSLDRQVQALAVDGGLEISLPSTSDTDTMSPTFSTVGPHSPDAVVRYSASESRVAPWAETLTVTARGASGDVVLYQGGITGQAYPMILPSGATEQAYTVDVTWSTSVPGIDPVTETFSVTVPAAGDAEPPVDPPVTPEPPVDPPVDPVDPPVAPEPDEPVVTPEPQPEAPPVSPEDPTGLPDPVVTPEAPAPAAPVVEAPEPAAPVAEAPAAPAAVTPVAAPADEEIPALIVETGLAETGTSRTGLIAGVAAAMAALGAAALGARRWALRQR